MIQRFLAAIFILATAAALIVVAWPQLFSLEQTVGIAQVVSLRGLSAAAAFLAVVALTLIALLSQRMRRFAAALAVVGLAFSALSIIVAVMEHSGRCTRRNSDC